MIEYFIKYPSVKIVFISLKFCLQTFLVIYRETITKTEELRRPSPG